MLAFGRKSIKRIGDAVLWVEAQRQGPGATATATAGPRGGRVQPSYRTFELTEVLTANNSASAKILKWNPAWYAANYQGRWEDSGETFTVQNAGVRREGIVGDRGVSVATPTERGTRWNVVSLQAMTATVIICSVNDGDGVEITDTSITVDGAEVIQPADGVLSPEPTTVVNALGLPADNDASIVGFRDFRYAADHANAWLGFVAPGYDPCVVPE